MVPVEMDPTQKGPPYGNEKEFCDYRNTHIGFIFQDYHLIDELTVYENIIIALTFMIGSALAAIGVVIYLLDGECFSFVLGSQTIGLYPFVAAVIGGIGSLPGAVIGGFLIGIIRAITQVYSNIGLSSWVDTIIYGIFVIILLIVVLPIITVFGFMQIGSALEEILNPKIKQKKLQTNEKKRNADLSELFASMEDASEADAYARKEKYISEVQSV